MYIIETNETPLIIIEESYGFILFKGKSITVNTIGLYEPIMKYLKIFINKRPLDTKMIIDLEYFNTSSSKYLLEIFKILKHLNKKGFSLRIDWYYDEEDESMFDAGQDYSDILSDIPFNLIIKK